MNWPLLEEETITISLTETDEETALNKEIVLFNDEVNTFDWVIESLIEVCHHKEEQAQQCAMITHYKGKCGVKSGSLKELKPMCENLLERGLSAEIV